MRWVSAARASSLAAAPVICYVPIRPCACVWWLRWRIALGQLARAAGITQQRKATRKVAKLDRERSRFVRDHFHKDPGDPTNYDLILNIARLSPDDCAEQIIDALHAEQASQAAKGVPNDRLHDLP